jgi:hypothetical protein
MQSLIATIILNTILLVAIYVLLGETLQAAGQTTTLFLVGGAITLILALINYFLGNRAGETEAARPVPAPVATSAPTPVAAPKVQPQAQTVDTSRYAERGAVQMLSILQRQGRLIDFLREDLQMYDDAQIGAAVRTIHQGCRQALDEHVKVEPIFSEAEGSTVSIQTGFDPHAVRLTGSVVGQPPFRGELRHRGWRVTSIDLPQLSDGRDQQQIVAAAEVEVAG